MAVAIGNLSITLTIEQTLSLRKEFSIFNLLSLRTQLEKMLSKLDQWISGEPVQLINARVMLFMVVLEVLLQVETF